MRFSERTGWDTAENAQATAVRRAREAGREPVDLTVSNPTVCGFEYDLEATLGALGNPAAMVYDPDARGIGVAREAVAGYYAGHGAAVDPGNVVLTTSTSEAYSFLFRLLCDPGDEVLVAQPSYPLFDFLADLDDVRLKTFPLFYDFGWWIDFAELEMRIEPKTKAVILVHPNNPTGHATGRAEAQRLGEICAKHGLALIVDEVFLDYGFREAVETFAGREHHCPVFVISGLSKIAGLPQMKVGWILALGPESERRAALGRLDVVADTFLSMNAPAQWALGAWLRGSGRIQQQIRRRVLENFAALECGNLWMSPLSVEAGWSAIVRFPQRAGSDDLAERLVHEASVVVHPGGFYGIPQQHYVVVSLLGPVESFKRGLWKLNEWCESKELTGSVTE